MSRRIIESDDEDEEQPLASSPPLDPRNGSSAAGSPKAPQQDLSKALFGSDSDDDDNAAAGGGGGDGGEEDNGQVDDAGLFGEESEDEGASHAQQQPKPSKKILLDENDLFGDDDDDDDGVAAVGNVLEQEVDQDEDVDMMRDYDEDEDQEDVVEKPVITDETLLPDISGPKDSENLFLLKIPNFLSIDSNLFSPEDYIKTNQDRDEDEDDSLILMDNTIRWRYNAQMAPESNARIVRWSNGTYSLLIGEEVFDVGTTDISSRFQFLSTQFPQEGFLKTQARLRRFMSFTPHSTQSMAHRTLIAQLARKHKKINKTKQFTSMEDPEKMARDAEKAEMERLKAKRKLEAKQEASLAQEYGVDRYSSGRRTQGGYGGNLDEYEQDGFIEEDDDLGQYGGAIYDEEDDVEEVDDEDDREDRLQKAKRSAPNGDTEKAAAPPPQKSKRLRIIEDSDSE